MVLTLSFNLTKTLVSVTTGLLIMLPFRQTFSRCVTVDEDSGERVKSRETIDIG